MAVRSILVDRNEMMERCKSGINLANSVHIVGSGRSLRDSVHMSQIHNGTLLERNKVVQEYFELVMADHVQLENEDSEKLFCLDFQGDDRPFDSPGVSWQIKKTYKSLTLLPDFYYVQQQGYKAFLTEEVVPWSDRTSRVLWRGGTTGGWNMSLEDALQLPRVQLCRIGVKSGLPVDFGICNVVQAVSLVEKEAIEKALVEDGIFKHFMPLESFQSCKFFIQIDGNGNSWELVKKLRLGSCMLLVDSDWILWHNRQIKPWVHYVPVRNDLGDLVQQIEWCLSHEDDARHIADRARNYALSLDFKEEMKEAARLISLAAEESFDIGPK